MNRTCGERSRLGRLSRTIAIAALLCLGLTAFAQDKPRFVVHEWGTFTTVSGGDGVALEWRPLSGPSDLPSFVYGSRTAARGLRHGQACDKCGHFGCGCGDKCTPSRNGDGCTCKGCFRGDVRMETPVLYFYADKETTVSVKVDFPKGRITEWYPKARAVGRGIDWGGVRILPGAAPQLPRETGESHYYPARETDACPVRVCGAPIQHEKFLFYRGAGSFPLPVQVGLEGSRVRVRAEQPIADLVLLECSAGKATYSLHRDVRGEAILDRPSRPSETIGEDVASILVRHGLYAKEARAMVKTWQDTWFGDEGLRAFYIVPRKVTDAILPLTIEPAPAECVRVLVGRAEVLTPEFEKRVMENVAGLGDDSVERRDQAMAALRRVSRFVEPILKRALEKTNDSEVRARLRELLGG